ncbi:MAG: trigger factor [Chloroflexota bacterium]|nr:trigger factor [Chloroflexota bacterium]
MQITREDLPDRQVALIMEFEPQEIEPALTKTYQRLVQKVNIPGFRPGKAPRAIFERHVGREALVQEASQGLMADAIKEALEREGLQGAEVDDADIESTDPLRIRVVFDQEPLIEVGDYSDIRVPAAPVNVTPDDVDLMLEHLRRRDAKWHDLAEPRPARYGDQVTVDLETFTIDGPVSNMTGTEQTLELSEKTGPAWPHEIDEGIVGMTIGEEKDLAIVFPAVYTDTALQGKDASVHVKLTAIQEAELPELDDAFAAKLAAAAKLDETETLADLRTRLETNLRTEQETNARSAQVQAALTQMKERSRVEVPKSMVDSEIQQRYDSLAARLQERRIAPARYFTYEGTTEAAWREGQREAARAALQELLVLREFAGREGISVETAEIQAEMDVMLEPYADNEQLEQLRGLLDTEQQRTQIANRLFERKLTDRLIAIAEGRTDAAGAADADIVDADIVDATAADTDVADTDATTDEATDTAALDAPLVPSGAVPATDQEPGPLELAGGAAEALGNGSAVDEER